MSENQVKKTENEPEFEEALQRLEEVVREMESGSLSLETMIQRFEEGSVLVEVCSRKLNAVEGRIQKLVRKDNQVIEEPFDEASS